MTDRSSPPPGFEQLYDEYANLLYGTVMRILGDHQLAEDAFQETWVRAARSLRGGFSPEHPAAWLLTISRREAYRIADRRTKTRPMEEIPAREEIPRVDVDDEWRRILVAIGTLPESDAEILTLRYVEGRSVADLQERFEVTRQTIWKRLQKSLSRLLQALRTTDHGEGGVA
jgi:RNA polymerase sigma-70 factor (ECF subfamily)